jgi:putative transposase
LDEVVLKISGVKHWLWRAVDQTGMVLDVLVQRRRDKQAAKRLLRKLLKRQMRPPRVMITDKLASYGAAKREVMPKPADTPSRTTDETVQIGRPGAALSLRP